MFLVCMFDLWGVDEGMTRSEEGEEESEEDGETDGNTQRSPD